MSVSGSREAVWQALAKCAANLQVRAGKTKDAGKEKGSCVCMLLLGKRKL